jgi:tricorn protease-like protein
MRYQIIIYLDFFTPFIAREYNKVPKIAIDDPTIDPVDMGVLKAITEATMITTLLIVFPTA